MAVLASQVVPEDLFSLPLVHGVALDARGERAAFVVTKMSADDDEYVGSIRVVSIRDGSVRTFTRGSARDLQPRFTPDGQRLLFISDRGGRRQIWLIDIAGGEPYAAPAIPAEVSAALFSPDGRFIAAVATPDTQRREIARRGWRRIDRMRYRADGAGYLDDAPQLWLVDLDAGTARALTDGSGWIGAPAWAPDGGTIAFVAEHRPEADSLWHTELWTVPVASGGKPAMRCRVGGALEAPAWSPDGSRIAFIGFENPESYALAPLRLFDVAADGSGMRCLVASDDWVSGNHVLNDLEASQTVAAPVWHADGSLYVLGTRHGSAGVYRVDARGATVRLTPESQTVTEFALAGNALCASAASSANPPELYVADMDGSGWRRLTNQTQGWCASRNFREAERFVVAARSGSVEAWHIRGKGAQPHPAVLQIHGGPHAAYGEGFFLEFQLLAAAGIDVVFCNPRGSQGYGDAFGTAIRGDWAAPAFDDCMDVLAAAIERGGIDVSRLGVAGGSYGGYLTAWCVTHTDRFAAAIAMRPAINLASLWGTSEVGRMLEYELGCRPNDDPELYRRCSSLTYAGNAKTPLLLMHAENDYRCPISESEQMFTALKARGATVELLRFANADHGLSRAGPPRLRVARLSAIMDWFVRRLGTD